MGIKTEYERNEGIKKTLELINNISDIKGIQTIYGDRLTVVFLLQEIQISNYYVV